MNKATVPILARLAALEAPAQTAPGGARVIAGIADRSPMTALLREVNETILARSLVFESSVGSSLTLDVAGRRVLRLSAASGLTDADSCLAAPTLEDENKDDLIRLMQAVAAPRHELRVTSGQIGRGEDGMSVGLPVALLADLLLIDLNDVVAEPEAVSQPEEPLAPVGEPEPAAKSDTPAPVSGDFLGRFARGVGPTLIAWMIAGGDEDGVTEGPEEMVSHLQGFIADEAEAVSRQLDLASNRPGSPVCIVLGARLDEGHSILCARSAGGFLLGVIEGDATPTLPMAWAQALA